MLTDEEKSAIYRLAEGEKSVREQAIEIFRLELKRLSDGGYRGDIRSVSPEMAFMSEVDHPCPDYILRGKYRLEVLAAGRDENSAVKNK